MFLFENLMFILILPTALINFYGQTFENSFFNRCEDVQEKKVGVQSKKSIILLYSYRNRLLISACFSHASTLLVYVVHALKKACTYKQAFTVLGIYIIKINTMGFQTYVYSYNLRNFK